VQAKQIDYGFEPVYAGPLKKATNAISYRLMRMTSGNSWPN
jgi:hypothetical protein